MSAHNIGHELFAGNIQIVDPGDAGTITVDRSPAYVALVSAAAETRTLAAPTVVGAVIRLYMKTDGGNITLTYNTSSTYVFSDAGQIITFTSVYDGSSYLWTLTSNVQNSSEILTAAARTVRADEKGRTFILNAITTITVTLPAVALGLSYRFIVGPLGVANGQDHAVVVPLANDNTIFGGATVAGSDVPASAEGSINFIGTSGTTGLPGDWIDVECDGTNWNVNGRGTTAGSITFTT